MSDYQDVIAAEKATDGALQALTNAYDDGVDIVYAVLLVGETVALAVREAALRLDYVSRQLEERP